MKIIFLYGPPAAGKYTVGRLLADRTGFSLFHNHLIVDAVASVFPFGTEEFVRLREKFWLDTIRAAAGAHRSLIFTFQPEPSVRPDFVSSAVDVVDQAGGAIIFVHLSLTLEKQLERIDNPDRENWGKLKDRDLARRLHKDFVAFEAAMPRPHLRIDTGKVSASDSAAEIEGLLHSLS